MRILASLFLVLFFVTSPLKSCCFCFDLDDSDEQLPTGSYAPARPTSYGTISTKSSFKNVLSRGTPSKKSSSKKRVSPPRSIRTDPYAHRSLVTQALTIPIQLIKEGEGEEEDEIFAFSLDTQSFPPHPDEGAPEGELSVECYDPNGSHCNEAPADPGGFSTVPLGNSPGDYVATTPPIAIRQKPRPRW